MRVEVAAARCPCVSVSSFVSATVVAACVCSSTSATSFAAAFSLVTCCCSRSSDSSCAATAVFIVCRSSISSSPLVAAVVVFLCFHSRICDTSVAAAANVIFYCSRISAPSLVVAPSSSCVLPFKVFSRSSSLRASAQVFLILRVLQLRDRQLTSLQVHHVFARLHGDLLMTWGHRVAAMMQGILCILYLCRDSVSDCFCSSNPPIFLACGKRKVRSHRSVVASPSESCPVPPRQCASCVFLTIIT